MKRKRIWIGICILLCLMMIGCDGRTKNSRGEEENVVSIYALLTYPEKYDNQISTIHAVLSAKDGGMVLYPSEYNVEFDEPINGIWLGTYEEVTCISKEEAKALHGEYVTVTGTIRAKKKGPGDGYNCEMDTITSITKLKQVNPTPKG